MAEAAAPGPHEVDELALAVATGPGGPGGPFTRELIVARIDTESLPTRDLHVLRGRGKVREVIDTKGTGKHEISAWRVYVEGRADPEARVEVLFYRDKTHQQIRGARDITLRDAVEAVEDICEAAREAWGVAARVVSAGYSTLNATMEIVPPRRPRYAEALPPAFCAAGAGLNLQAMSAELAAFQQIEAEAFRGEPGERYAGTQVTFLNVQILSGGTAIRAEVAFDGRTLRKNPKLSVTGAPKARLKGAHSLRQLALVRLAICQILRRDSAVVPPRVLRPLSLPTGSLVMAAWMSVAAQAAEHAQFEGAADILAAAHERLAEALAYDPLCPVSPDQLARFLAGCHRRLFVA